MYYLHGVDAQTYRVDTVTYPPRHTDLPPPAQCPTEPITEPINEAIIPPIVPPEGKTTKRKMQISDKWRPNQKAIEIGQAEGFSAEEYKFIFEDFVTTCKAKGYKYVNFDMAFYKWLRSPITHSTITSRRRTKSSSERKPTLNQLAG